MADIPLRADTDLRYAEEVLQRIATAEPMAAFMPALNAIGKSADAKFYELQPGQLRDLPIMRLQSLERHWLFDARRLARWQADMRQATAWYASVAAELLGRRQVWQELKDEPGAASLPAALADRMNVVLAGLAEAGQALSGPLSRQAELEQRDNAVEEQVRAGQRVVAGAIDYVDARLLRVDSSPLWALERSTGSGDDTLTLLRTGVDIEARFARDYASAGSDNQRVLRAFQLLLLPLLLWLAHKSRQAIRAGVMSETAAGVLGRPFSTWLLLSMLGVLALERDSPLMVQQVALVLAAIPVLRLLPPPATGRWINGPTSSRVCSWRNAWASCSWPTRCSTDSRRWRLPRWHWRPSCGCWRADGAKCIRRVWNAWRRRCARWPGRRRPVVRVAGVQSVWQRFLIRNADQRHHRQRVLRTGALLPA